MNRSIGFDAQPENSDGSLGIVGLSNGRNAHHASTLSAESIKTCPNNSRKQPSLTRPRRWIDFMRLLKELI